MSDMKALIERLEQAEEGSEELDAEIHAALGGEDVRGDERMIAFLDLRYSRSLDAALSLVPADWTAWEVRSRRRRTAYVAEVSRLVETKHGEDELRALGYGNTPALALVAAALEARTTDGAQ